ncbi:MAG TPA: hypothetical protein VGN25_10225 [Solirubrobacteraceae bacterium]|nr:hypothetical protein [Solirubrobacteraceae bacterium]
MKRQRLTTATTLTAMALSMLAPLGAEANSLLSGYGGPGQGSQAILGSALVNGPGGGGGSSGGGATNLSGSAAGAGSGGSTLGARNGVVGSSRQGGGSSTHAAKRGGSRPDTSGSGSGTYKPAYPPSTATSSAVESSQVGLSNSDLLYVVLAAGALVLTGVLTRRLARPAR